MNLAEYGVGIDISIPVVKVDDTDFADTGDYAYAAGDIRISKDAGAFADVTNSPTEIDNATASVMYLELTLTAVEMQARRVDIQIVDAALEHQMLTFYTFGHPGSQFPSLGVSLPDSGTAQAGAAGSITLATSASGAADLYNGSIINIVSGTGAGQTRLITDYTAARVASVEPNWTTIPDTTSKYIVIPAPPGPGTTLPQVDVRQWRGTAVATPSVEGTPEVDVTHLEGANASDAIGDAVADDLYEGSYTLRQLVRLISSALFGKLSGAAGTNIVIRDTADTKNRIDATVDADGNRTAVTLDGS